MYQSPKLERFGTLRQLTAAPFPALGTSFSFASGSLPIGAGDCGPNVPVGGVRSQLSERHSRGVYPCTWRPYGGT